MKKQLFTVLIACSIYAFPDNQNEFQQKLDRLKELFATPAEKSFSVSLESGVIKLEVDDRKESLNCQDAYNLTVILAIMSGNIHLNTPRELFLNLCTTSKFKLTSKVTDHSVDQVSFEGYISAQ
jgi:hypothetical protein